MRLNIHPIVPDFRESLKQLLGPFGLPADVVEWKYFRRPWPNQLTGLAWVKDGRVRGCVGLIPFSLGYGGERRSASWTCDWVVDSPQTNPGIGIMLMQQARKVAGPLLSLGGNDVNRQMMPRLATWSVDQAAVELYLPLRVGGSRWFRGVDRRVGGALRPFAALPARSVGRGTGAIVTAGISPVLAPLLEAAPSEHAIPIYSLEYLRWQLEDAPGVTCVTVHAARSPVEAAGVCWSRAAAPADWRVALWLSGDDMSAAEEVLRAAMSYAERQGGQRLSILISRLDIHQLALLESLGFVREGTDRPLYVTGDGIDSGRAVARLSFLDTDLAYRV